MMKAFRGRGTRSSVRRPPRFFFGTLGENSEGEAESGVLVYAQSEAASRSETSMDLIFWEEVSSE